MSKKKSAVVALEFHDQRVRFLEGECNKLRLDLIARDKQAGNNWIAYTKMLDQRNREMEESARLRRLVSAIRQMAEVP